MLKAQIIHLGSSAVVLWEPIKKSSWRRETDISSCGARRLAGNTETVLLFLSTCNKKIKKRKGYNIYRRPLTLLLSNSRPNSHQSLWWDKHITASSTETCRLLKKQAIKKKSGVQEALKWTQVTASSSGKHSSCPTLQKHKIRPSIFV